MNREDIIAWAREAGWTGYDSLDERFQRFAALVIANNPPQSSMAWQEGFETGLTEQNKELAALREFAGGRCAIQSVIDAVGPMSLWSKDAFERELEKARAEEREACAKVCEDMRPSEATFDRRFFIACTLNANAIRARGEIK